MYVYRNITASSRQHICHGNEKIISLFIVELLKRLSKIYNIEIVAMERQQ
jgi:hypothetical protein